jgi:diguanylate cyclase (GGDEF)-like protein
MTAPVSEIESVIERLSVECYRVLECRGFELELLAGAGESGRWWAGPDGVLERGEARPAPGPPPLPGIHRRSGWEVIERLLGDEEKPLARLRLWCDPRRLPPADLALFEALRPQMAASLRQALLDREARVDGLTGTLVRRELERSLARAWAASLDRGGRLAVILCDLDRFKPINDTFGHTAGDRALATVGAVLAAHKRTADLLARYGGEEFALLLDDTDGDTALAVAERLRRRVEEIELEADGRRLTLSLSAGVAAFPEVTARTAGELMLLADEALYEAKRRGRNRCLLNAGTGRYRAPDGTAVEVDERPPGAGPPRLFA